MFSVKSPSPLPAVNNGPYLTVESLADNIYLRFCRLLCIMIYIYRKRAKCDIPVGPTTKSGRRQKQANDI